MIQPTPGLLSLGRGSPGHQLVAELRNTAYACASINAAVMASHRPRLYMRGTAGDAVEIHAHPLLDLLREVNPLLNTHDLLELTTLYQEVTGVAYWRVSTDVFGAPSAIWILPSQCLEPDRPTTGGPVSAWVYRSGGVTERYTTTEIIQFRYPDPCDPYYGGLSPLRGAIDSISLDRGYNDFKRSVWQRRGVPGTIISAKEVMSSAERIRLEEEFRQRFAGDQAGGAMVTEEAVTVTPLQLNMGDLTLLAEQSATKEHIANAFGVPISYLTSDTNLANLAAAKRQHAEVAIRTRIKRRDEKLNEQLIPRFDTSGRLYLETPDPVDGDPEQQRDQDESDLRFGIRTINEVRRRRGLTPVPWGNQPFNPVQIPTTTEAMR